MISAAKIRDIARGASPEVDLSPLEKKRKKAVVELAKIDAEIILAEMVPKLEEQARKHPKQTFFTVAKKQGYNPKYEKLGAMNIIHGAPAKADRRCPQDVWFSFDDPWRYLINPLLIAGYQLSFEVTVTSLDERADDLYLLKIYWD